MIGLKFGDRPGLAGFLGPWEGQAGGPCQGMAGCADVFAVLFVEGFIMLKTLQYLLIGAGFSACMLFVLALAIPNR